MNNNGDENRKIKIEKKLNSRKGITLRRQIWMDVREVIYEQGKYVPRSQKKKKKNH